MEKPKIALYKKIKEDILRMIGEENIIPHSKLPSESELAVKFGTSKMTSKMALDSLQKDGIIYRIPRKGNFVAEEFGIGRLTQVFDEIKTENRAFIGIILPAMDYYTSEILQRLEKELSKNNYLVAVKITNNIVANEEMALLEFSTTKNIFGIILFPANRRFCGDALISLQLRKYPIVLIDTIFRELSLDSVYHDHYQGAYDITQYLINKGHTKIGHATYDIEHSYSRQERLNGYTSAMNNNNIFVNKDFIFPLEDYTKRNSYRNYLKANLNLTAIFCSHDFLAANMLYSLQDLRYEVPRDISIVGFTDNKLLSFLPIGITTVRQPTKRLSVKAVELLIERIKNPNQPINSFVVENEIVIRESVRLLL